MQQYLIFIDFSSAFDGIDHQLLIDKIIHKGKCSKETLNLLKWYLNHINIRINEDMIMLNKGSPQGCRSSPILWILYIDDLLDELENMADLRNVFAFADDLMIYCRSLPLAYKVVRAILKWSQDNKIKVNTKKSAILPLAKTKRKTDKFDKSILNVPYVTTYKYLGITFDYTMKFRQTLENTTKIVRNMNNYKVLGKSNMSLTQRLQICKTYFHSKILYPLMVLSMINKISADKNHFPNFNVFQEHLRAKQTAVQRSHVWLAPGTIASGKI